MAEDLLARESSELPSAESAPHVHEMIAKYKEMLTYIRSAVTRNMSEKKINKRVKKKKKIFMP